MTSAWFLGASHGVPQDESAVRSTIEPIRVNSDSAELQDAPEWNEIQTDDSGELVGLSPRMVAGDTHDIEKYAPIIDTFNHNRIIDDQVSSSGTAAAREASGVQGHGTMQWTESLEPVIRDGGAYGNDYFAADPVDIQSGAGEYMSPDLQGNNHWASRVAAANAEKASRQAYMSSLFSDFVGTGI